MWNNRLTAFALLTVLSASVCSAPVLLAQGTTTRTAAGMSTIKDDEIYVPEKALLPPYSKKEAAELLTRYIDAFGDSDMPRSYEVFAKDPSKYKRISKLQILSCLSSLYNYVKDPDIPEVTEARPDWFKTLYNKALELKDPAGKMDTAIRKKNAALYTQATTEYAAKYTELKQFVAKKPERMDALQLKQIIAANRARRKATYVALKKKQMQEREAAIQKELDAQKKRQAAESKKKN